MTRHDLKIYTVAVHNVSLVHTEKYQTEPKHASPAETDHISSNDLTEVFQYQLSEKQQIIEFGFNKSTAQGKNV